MPLPFLVNFPFISCNIPASPVYGVYISQSIRYSRACAQYNDFLDRAQLLTQKLLKKGYVANMLKSSLQKIRYDFHMKTMFGSSLPPVVCRREHILRFVVFACLWWGPTHIVFGFCFVFLRLLYPMLPVSLYCPFLYRLFGIL